MNLENFTGYILAGGKSSRMGTDKAFLKIGDETFLNRAVKTLSPVCENRIVIVLNRTQTHFIEKLPRDVSYIFDVYENRGALGGIYAALKNCLTKYAVILAVDLPFVTGEAIENLARIAFEPENEAAIVPIQNDGRPQPLCAVYRVENCLPKIEELLNETVSASVKDFLELVPTRSVEQNKLTSDKSANLFFNANHPSDFDKILSHFAEK